MKKILLLASLLIFVLVACGSEETQELDAARGFEIDGDGPLVYIFNAHPLEMIESTFDNLFVGGMNIVELSHILAGHLEADGIPTLVEDRCVNARLYANDWGFYRSYYAARYYLYDVIERYPSLQFFIDAAPWAILLYLIAFGEIVVTQTVIKEAGEVRKDEIVDYNVNRTNVIIGIRNAILALIAPYPPMAGPNWVGGTVSTVERYKQGKKGMNSLHDGLSSFIFAMAVAALARPLVTLLQPVFPVAMLITLILTGFACAYVAIGMLKNREDQGIAAIMSIIIFTRGAAEGLITGVVLHILVSAYKKYRKNGINEE